MAGPHAKSTEHLLGNYYGAIAGHVTSPFEALQVRQTIIYILNPTEVHRRIFLPKSCLNMWPWLGLDFWSVLSMWFLQWTILMFVSLLIVHHLFQAFYELSSQKTVLVICVLKPRHEIFPLRGNPLFFKRDPSQLSKLPKIYSQQWSLHKI